MSEELLLERLYTIPLRHAWVTPRKRRSARAIRLVKEFVQRHLKADRIVITNEVNEAIWRRGAEKPPRRIKVKVVVEETDEGSVATVYLAE